MKEEKNHVGRPTNEEVKVRKKKKLIKAISILCVITIVVIGTIMLTKAVDTGKLEGSNRRVSNIDKFGFKDPEWKTDLSFDKSDCLIGGGDGFHFSNSTNPGIKFVRITYSYNTEDRTEEHVWDIYGRYLKGAEKLYRTPSEYPEPHLLFPKPNTSVTITLKAYADIPSKDNHGKYIYSSVPLLSTTSYKINLDKKCKIKGVYKNVKYEEDNINKITKKTTTKKSAKTGLKLNCPESAKVNKEFTCTTNAKGVKISVSKTNLAKGYNTSFKTTANDKTKQSKYTKTGTVTVKAELSGYKSVEKKVKIVSSATTKNSALNGKCSAKLSAIGNYKMQYTTSCTGNAKVTNIAYQVINPSNNTAITKLINRGSGWGSYKAGTSTIVFASDRKGKKIKVRVYYDTNSSSKSTSHYQDSYEILK